MVTSLGSLRMYANDFGPPCPQNASDIGIKNVQIRNMFYCKVLLVVYWTKLICGSKLGYLFFL